MSVRRDRARPAAAYRLARDGAPWSHVAARLGYADGRAASKTARRWALAHGEPWPPQRVAAPRAGRASDRPRLAYALATAGATWARTAALLGYAAERVAHAQAARWARSARAPWPPPRPEGRDPGRMVLDLETAREVVRASLASGLDVGDVVRLTGLTRAVVGAVAGWRPRSRLAMRERDAEIRRLVEGSALTLAEIGARFGLGRERVRQIACGGQGQRGQRPKRPTLRAALDERDRRIVEALRAGATVHSAARAEGTSAEHVRDLARAHGVTPLEEAPEIRRARAALARYPDLLDACGGQYGSIAAFARCHSLSVITVHRWRRGLAALGLCPPPDPALTRAAVRSRRARRAPAEE